MSKQVQNGDWILDKGTDEDLTLSIGKRHDPFVDVFVDFKTLQMKESGEVEIKPNEEVIKAVNEAILTLDPDEQEIINFAFYQCLNTKQIAEIQKTKYHLVKWAKTKAVEKIKIHLCKNYYKLSNKEVHTDCPLCSFEKYEELDVFIHLWYDFYDGQLKGITKEIRKQFGSELADKLAVNSRLIEQHLDTHLGIGKAGRRKVGKYNTTDSEEQITLKGQIKDRVLKLSTDTGLDVDKIVHGILKVGIPIYRELIYKKKKAKK